MDMLIRFILLSLIVLFNVSVSAKTQPKFLIVPVGSINVTVTDTETAIVQYKVTNQTAITRQLIMSSISGVAQVTDGSGYCSNTFTLASGQSCLLTLKVIGSQLPHGTTNSTIKICKTNSNSNTPDAFLCSQTSTDNNLNIVVKQSIARITVTPHILNLSANGSSGQLTIRNISSSVTATNISANLSGTILNGNVVQNSSSCVSVAPGGTCSLVFTPGSTAVSLTSFKIQGDNTTFNAAAIKITEPSVADISVSGSPLILTAGGSSGTLTITNNSSTVSTTNVQAALSPLLAASVTQDATDCATLAPKASCNLVFTPAINAQAVSLTTVLISGDNSTETSAQIAVNASSLVTISITAGSPLVLKADGLTTGTMTITNESTTTSATNVVANFNSTSLLGNVTATSCSTIAPQSTCTITYTPGFVPVVATNFSISGSNTTTVTGTLSISPYLLYVVNLSSDGSTNVSVCSVSLSDGSLSGCGSTGSNSLGFNSTAIAFNYAATNAYIPAEGPGVYECTVNSTSGALSLCNLTYITDSTDSYVGGIVYNPLLNIIYITTSSSNVFQCSLSSSGQIQSPCTNSGATGIGNPQNIAINPDSTIVYIANANGGVVQCTASTSNGSLSGCSSNSLSGYNFGVGVNSSNTFAYVTSNSLNLVYWCSIDQTGGQFTTCNNTSSATLMATGLALNSVSNYLYIGNFGNYTVNQCTVNSGAVSSCGSSGASGSFNGQYIYGVSLYPTPP